MEAFTVHGVFKIARFTDAPCMSRVTTHLTSNIINGLNYFDLPLKCSGTVKVKLCLCTSWRRLET